MNQISEETKTNKTVQDKGSDPQRLISLRDLERGMIIRHKGDSKTWLVDENYGERVTVVSSMDVTNIHEWEIVT